MKQLQHSFWYLPTPSNIHLMWNMGFLLGVILSLQISTGLFLSFHYSASVTLAFSSFNHLLHNVSFGWLLQLIHANGASAFFILIYLHIARGLYFNSHQKTSTWNTGLILLILLMISAFLGYVLPWGQMSYWGATVITNLLSAIPYMGQMLVEWLWGGFSVQEATLHRFFALHFLLPFVLLAMISLHLMTLHHTGSFNPLGTSSDVDKSPFYPYFLSKDLTAMLSLICLLSMGLFFHPYIFAEPDNFIEANALVTPTHIQPEWYFLFAYAILRSIPNKLGGVSALAWSLMILLFLPLMRPSLLSLSFKMNHKWIYWSFMVNFSLLTWMGAQPVEEPFFSLSQTLAVMYFFLILLMST